VANGRCRKLITLDKKAFAAFVFTRLLHSVRKLLLSAPDFECAYLEVRTRKSVLSVCQHWWRMHHALLKDPCPEWSFVFLFASSPCFVSQMDTGTLLPRVLVASNKSLLFLPIGTDDVEQGARWLLQLVHDARGGRVALHHTAVGLVPPVNAAGQSCELKKPERAGEEKVDASSSGSSSSQQQRAYGVRRLLKKRTRGGRAEYLVEWQGYSKTASSWEPETNILCPELIGAFEEKLARRSTHTPRRRPPVVSSRHPMMTRVANSSRCSHKEHLMVDDL
jgi:hypothetical protein